MAGRGPDVALGRVRTAVRQIKLFAAIETHLIRPAFDGEDPAQVTMTTAEGELENPTQRVHRSYNRAWRREGGSTTIDSPLFERILSRNGSLRFTIRRLP